MLGAGTDEKQIELAQRLSWEEAGQAALAETFNACPGGHRWPANRCRRASSSSLEGLTSHSFPPLPPPWAISKLYFFTHSCHVHLHQRSHGLWVENSPARAADDSSGNLGSWVAANHPSDCNVGLSSPQLAASPVHGGPQPLPDFPWP